MQVTISMTYIVRRITDREQGQSIRLPLPVRTRLLHVKTRGAYQSVCIHTCVPRSAYLRYLGAGGGEGKQATTVLSCGRSLICWSQLRKIALSHSCKKILRTLRQNDDRQSGIVADMTIWRGNSHLTNMRFDPLQGRKLGKWRNKG